MMESTQPAGGGSPASDARQALAAASDARRSVGEQLVLPPGVDVLHAVGIALTVAGAGCLGALDTNLATRIATPVLFLSSLALLWIALKKFKAANGVWFTSSDGPWQARVVWATLTFLVTLLGIASAISGASGTPWGVVVCTLVAFAVGIVFSRWWVSALRSGLTRG